MPRPRPIERAGRGHRARSRCGGEVQEGRGLATGAAGGGRAARDGVGQRAGEGRRPATAMKAQRESEGEDDASRNTVAGGPHLLLGTVEAFRRTLTLEEGKVAAFKEDGVEPVADDVTASWPVSSLNSRRSDGRRCGRPLKTGGVGGSYFTLGWAPMGGGATRVRWGSSRQSPVSQEDGVKGLQSTIK